VNLDCSPQRAKQKNADETLYDGNVGMTKLEFRLQGRSFAVAHKNKNQSLLLQAVKSNSVSWDPTSSTQDYEHI